MFENESFSLRNSSRFLQVILFSLILLYLGRALFIPLSFGLLVAIVSYPFCRFLEIKGWPRGLAVLTLLMVLVFIFASLLWILIYESQIVLNDLPAIKEKFQSYFKDIGEGLNSDLGVSLSVQQNMRDKFLSGSDGYFEKTLTLTLSATSSMATSLFLIPIFTGLFLIHRGRLVRFISAVVGKQHELKLNSILQESIVSYYRFVKGTFFVYCIVAVLNSLGLFLLGIEHALLFGTVTAFLTVIPYIGIVISGALPIAVALVTKDSIWYPIGVVAVFSVVQYLEANVIFPRVVGQQLGLSTLAMILAMIIGTLLWGLAGMVLFTPFVAIFKIFCDKVEGLKAIRILLNRNALQE